jgi:hypothetical protein
MEENWRRTGGGGTGDSQDFQEEGPRQYRNGMEENWRRRNWNLRSVELCTPVELRTPILLLKILFDLDSRQYRKLLLKILFDY